MASIFPPLDKGGVPPGTNVRNGYVPGNAVVGEGPLYISADCSTVLTDEQVNAFTSELLAAVDLLGFSWNSAKVTNLGDALIARLKGATEDFVNVSGDTMTGPLVLAGDPTGPLDAVPRQFVVARGGDTMEGPLILAGPPVQPLEATTKQYTDSSIADLRTEAETALDVLAAEVARRVLRSGDTMTGALVLDGVSSISPTADVNAAMSKSYIDTQDNKRVAKSGDVMTGLLTLSGDPVAPLDAVPKQFVEAGFVSKFGDTMEGPLILDADPTTDLGAATKHYVDSQEALDGTLYLKKAGDAMTGPLTLASDPSFPLQAATKQYVDAHGGGGGGGGGSATFLLQEFTATQGQTTFTVTGGFSVGKIIVSRGGTVQENADFTASDGLHVTLALPCEAGEVVKVLGFFDVKTGLAMPRYRYIATQGQTTFSGTDANGAVLAYSNAASVLVFVRGVLAPPTSYTATDGTSIVLSAGLQAGDVLEVAAFSYVALVDGISYLTAQGLTTVQRDQARKNIYAAPADLLLLNNLAINGDFDIVQEYGINANNPVAGGGAAQYFADMWVFSNGFTNPITPAVGIWNPNNNGGIRNYCSLTSPTAQPAPTGSQYCQITQAFEGVRFARVGWGNIGANGQPITISFGIRATKAGIGSVSIRNGQGLDRSFVAPFTIATPGANTWVSITVPPDTTADKWSSQNTIAAYLTISFGCGPTLQTSNLNVWQSGNFSGVAGATNFFDAANSSVLIIAVSVVPGNVAPINEYQFAAMMRPYDQELALCLRYYEKNDSGAWFTGALNNQPGVGTITDAIGYAAYKVRKRSNPTVTLYNGATANQVSDYFFGAINGPFSVFGDVDGFSQVGKTGAFLQGRPIAFGFRADARM